MERNLAALNMESIFEVMLDRHEAKYLIASDMIPEIRSYIRPFCEADKNSRASFDGYLVTTLQLDTPNFSFHAAKPDNALTRFKLRVRTYGLDGRAPVFLEVKRKIRASVVKTRAAVPPEAWSERLFQGDAQRLKLDFRSPREAEAFYEFVRLARQCAARPAVRVRYNRESYFGLYDRYARVTFDSKLCYQRADDWSVLGGPVWHSMDDPGAQGKSLGHSSAVLELKALHEPPRWMMALVEKFGLTRTGNCKYSCAVLQEAWDLGITEDRKEWIWGL